MMLRKLTRDQAIGFDEKTGELFPIDPESLRDVDLDSTIDGKTPLELCLDKFNSLAIGDDSDCRVCGMWEMHKSVIALLEAGATITPGAMEMINDLQQTSNMIKTIRSFDPLDYDSCWGAEEEADAVLACTAKMMVPAPRPTNEDPNTERRGNKRKQAPPEAGSSSGGGESSTTTKKQTM